MHSSDRAEKVTTWSSYISAGWAITGSIKNQLRRLAWECDLKIEIAFSTGLTGRTIDFKVEGPEKKVGKFREVVTEACRAMM